MSLYLQDLLYLLIVKTNFVSSKEFINNSAKKGKRGRRPNCADLPPTTPNASKSQEAAVSKMALASNTPTPAISERSERRRRKPAFDESEFELTPTVAKRRKATSSGNVAISPSLRDAKTASLGLNSIPVITQIGGLPSGEKQRLIVPQSSKDGNLIAGVKEDADLAQEELANHPASELSGMNSSHLNNNSFNESLYSAEYPEDEFLMELDFPPRSLINKTEPGK